MNSATLSFVPPLSSLNEVFHLLVLGGLVLSLLTVLANLACFDGLRESAPPGPDAAIVSILVPARNEARNIAACVGSLLAQDYPNCQLIVLDDCSDDDTARIVRELGLREDDPRRRLMHGTPLPDGWTGKGWACHQLAAQANGEFLFFTDADTHHAPGTVTAAVAYAQRTGADLLSAWPRLITATWGEKLIIPMILLLGMVLYPHWLVLWIARTGFDRHLPRRVRRTLGAANGQFLFFARAAYERIGGHTAVRDHLVEDVALGRAITAEGLRLRNCDALRFSTCRMYRSFGEVWEGFSKNMRPAFERSLPSFLLVGATQFCLFLLPCVLLFLPHAPRGIVALEVGLIFLIRLLLTIRFRTSWLSLFLHPIGHALALAIGLNSWRLSVRRGLTWKGRTYAHRPSA